MAWDNYVVPVPNWDATIQAAKTPESKVVGGVSGGFILIDEIAKHAVLSWIVERIEESFGKARVLAFVEGHPFAAYGLLVAIWVAFVYYWAARSANEGAAAEPSQQSSGPTANASGSSSAFIARDIHQEIRDSGDVRMAGRDYHETYNKTTIFNRVNEPEILVSLRDDSRNTLYLSTPSEVNAYKVQVSSIITATYIAKFEELPCVRSDRCYEAIATITNLSRDSRVRASTLIDMVRSGAMHDQHLVDWAIGVRWLPFTVSFQGADADSPKYRSEWELGVDHTGTPSIRVINPRLGGQGK